MDELVLMIHVGWTIDSLSNTIPVDNKLTTLHSPAFCEAVVDHKYAVQVTEYFAFLITFIGGRSMPPIHNLFLLTTLLIQWHMSSEN